MTITTKEKIIGGSKIAVCMSGGVDSSTAAYLLKQKGYEVIGLTGWLIKGTGRCCDSGMIDANKVCEQIGINHVSKDLRELFKAEIIDPFIGSYSTGATPLPCIVCNNEIKWGSLLQYALDELKCTHIATGHYAKLIAPERKTRELAPEDLSEQQQSADRRFIKDKEGFKIARAKDQNKDQTFMLWGLTQETLAKTVFPLGDLTKDEVREIAKKANLEVANKEESQDICFVSNTEGTKGFLEKYLQPKEGKIIENKTGKILGTHQGAHNFTIGQRKGLGIAYSEPLYVIKLDIEKNIVYAGTKEELEGYELIAKDVNWILNPATNVMAKIRYLSDISPACVTILEDNTVKVTFKKPQTAITKGQSVVFYDEMNQILLGGGWIT